VSTPQVTQSPEQDTGTHAQPRGAQAERGVYWIAPDGQRHRVHIYQGGDYALEDIAEYFALGEVSAGAPDTSGEDTSALRLREPELRELKVLADSQSFDFEAPFIEMCLEIYRFCLERPAEVQRFVADF